MGGDETLHLEDAKPQGDQPHLRPLNDPGWSEGGSPWDRDTSSVVGVCPWALVPVSSCAEEVTKHSSVVENNLGGSPEGWSREGRRWDAAMSLLPPAAISGHKQQGQGSKLEAHPCPLWKWWLLAVGWLQSHHGTSWTWVASCFSPAAQGRHEGTATTHRSTGERAGPCLWQAAAGRC